MYGSRSLEPILLKKLRSILTILFQEDVDPRSPSSEVGRAQGNSLVNTAYVHILVMRMRTIDHYLELESLID